MRSSTIGSRIAALALVLELFPVAHPARAQSDPEYPLPTPSESTSPTPERAPPEAPLHPVEMGPANPASPGQAQAPAGIGSPRSGPEAPFDPTGGLRTFLESLPDRQRKEIEHRLNRKAAHALVGRTDSLSGTYALIHEKFPPPRPPLVHVFLLTNGKAQLLFTSTAPFRVPAHLRIAREDKMALILSYIFFQQANRVPPVLSQEARPTGP